MDELAHPFPRQPVPLTASPQTFEPRDADMIAKCCQCMGVGRHRKVGIVASYDGAEPLPLLVYRRLSSPPQRFFDLLKLGAHFADRGR